MSFDVWGEFGIQSLSPSQLTKWSQCRGQWYASARGKVYEDAGPAAWRGDAVEGGLHAWLLRHEAPESHASKIFSARALEYAYEHDGECHPDHEAEAAKIGPALERAIAAWEAEQLGALAAYQPKCEAFLPGTRVKMSGKGDFAVAGRCVDLKTTGQLPSENKPKIEHAIAASFYAFAREEKEACILYVSTAGNPKIAHRLVTLDAVQIDYYIAAAAEIVLQIETTLLAAVALSEFELVSAEDALARLCRPNMLAQGGGVFPIWKPEYAERARAAVPAWS